MKNYEPTPRQSLAIREFVSEAITPLIEDVLVKKLGQAMAFLKEQEQTEREWVGLTADEIWKCNKAEPGSAVEFHICVAHQNLMDFAEALEAKLREKNRG